MMSDPLPEKTFETLDKQHALIRATAMMEAGAELTSALQQAAADLGLPYGDEMGKFVAWAYKELGCD